MWKNIVATILFVGAVAFASSIDIKGPGAAGSSPTFGAVTGTNFIATSTTVLSYQSGALGSGTVAFGPNTTLGIGFNAGGGDVQFISSSAEQWRVDGATGNLISSPGRSVNTGGTYISTIASGSQAVTINNGARIGTGASGFLSWDGSNNAQFTAPGVYAINTNAQYFAQMGSSTSYFASEGVANVTTTDVTSSGNASNLISYTLPANALTSTNRCLKIIGWGTSLNNANAKTVSLAFGGQTVISKQLNVSIASETWKLTAIVCRTGASTQDIFAEGWNEGGTTVSGTDGPTVQFAAVRTAGTQTETATIVIKGVATTATTTDITMDALIVEYL